MHALIAQADQRLREVEGHALEDLAFQLYQERSRLGLGDFSLSQSVRGYWDRSDIEIDLVAVDEDGRRLRFGTCKRNPQRLPAAVPRLREHAARFLATQRRFADWSVDYVAIAPEVDANVRAELRGPDILVQDLRDLTQQM